MDKPYIINMQKNTHRQNVTKFKIIDMQSPLFQIRLRLKLLAVDAVDNVQQRLAYIFNFLFIPNRYHI